MTLEPRQWVHVEPRCYLIWLDGQRVELLARDWHPYYGLIVWLRGQGGVIWSTPIDPLAWVPVYVPSTFDVIAMIYNTFGPTVQMVDYW